MTHITFMNPVFIKNWGKTLYLPSMHLKTIQKNYLNNTKLEKKKNKLTVQKSYSKTLTVKTRARKLLYITNEQQSGT